MKPKVAFIGTGGTISSLGAGPLDILDYGASDNRMQADAIVAMFPQWAEVAEVIPVNFDNVVSHNIYFDLWKKLVLLCDGWWRRFRTWPASSSGMAPPPSRRRRIS
ncbi:MAG: asparaginase domain-containing protein [Acetobacteraceae bacterium]